MKTILTQLCRAWEGHRFNPINLVNQFNFPLALALCALCCANPPAAWAGSPPVVTNVTAAQRPYPSKAVDIFYNLSDPDSTSVNVFILVSKDSGATWTVPANKFTDSLIGVGVPVSTGSTRNQITWDAGEDWDGHFTDHCRVRVLANDLGLVLIPFGSYLRGNYVASQGSGDADITDAPQYSVSVSAFFMDQDLVTGGKWNLVKEGYADSHGYVFENAGSFKAADHPVQTVNWLDAVKWCNARSQMEGVAPVYYTSSAFTTVLKTGTASSTTPFVKPGANGYRLPTEAEWERATRGGVEGYRFPYGDVILERYANYYGDTTDFSYDLGPDGYNALFTTGGLPFTSPANGGIFVLNFYRLHDMAGNVFEWCWDWYGASYYAPGQSDPQGPSSGSGRVLRGGSWNDPATYARCANRYYNAPAFANYGIGFRCVKGL